MSSSTPAVEFNPNLEHDGKLYDHVFIGLGIAGAAVVATGVVPASSRASSSAGEAAPAAPPPATTARATFAPRARRGPRGRGGGSPILSAVVERPRIFSSARALSLATFVVTIVGCYNPSIKNGGYKCSTMFDPSCPSGFTCDTSTGRCVNGPLVNTDAGFEAQADMTSTDAPVDKPAIEAGHDATIDVACFQPVATEPTCPTTCKCHEKCAVVNGALTCTAPFGAGKVGDACTTATDGSDNCSPGLTCIMDGCGARCYAYCRTDVDCPMSACSRDGGAGQKVCDVPYVTCHAIKDPNPTIAWGCPLQNEGCYLSPSVADQTLCDCPVGMQGGIGASCTPSRQSFTPAMPCFAGLVCLDPTGGNNFQCHQVCSLTSTTNTCVNAGACLPLNFSKTYGFCN